MVHDEEGAELYYSVQLDQFRSEADHRGWGGDH